MAFGLIGKVAQKAGKAALGKGKSNMSGGLLAKGLGAFRNYQDKKSATKKLNTPGNFQTKAAGGAEGSKGMGSLAVKAGAASLPKVGQSGGGFAGGDAWQRAKSQPLFK